MAFDSLTPYLIGSAAGVLLGFLLRHLMAAKGASDLEKNWLDQLRKAKSDVERLRNDLKAAAERASVANDAEVEAKRKVAALEATLEERNAQIAGMEPGRAANQSRVNAADFHAKIREREERIHKLTQELAQVTQSGAALDVKLKQATARVAELEPLVAKLAAANQDRRNLETRLRAFEVAKTLELGTLHTRLSDLKEQEERHEHVQRSLKNRDAEVGRLRAQLTDLKTRGESDSVDWKQSVTDAQSRLAVWDLRFRAVVDEKDAIIRGLKQQLQTPPAASKNGAAAPPPPSASLSGPDDLKQIAGIGPVLEGKLKEIGIHSFRQIARWTPDDIREFESRMPQFRKRVERDNWIAGAREAHLKKYGETI